VRRNKSALLKFQRGFFAKRFRWQEKFLIPPR
jgi:hypothetical protein